MCWSCGGWATATAPLPRWAVFPWRVYPVAQRCPSFLFLGRVSLKSQPTHKNAFFPTAAGHLSVAWGVETGYLNPPHPALEAGLLKFLLDDCEGPASFPQSFSFGNKFLRSMWGNPVRFRVMARKPGRLFPNTSKNAGASFADQLFHLWRTAYLLNPDMARTASCDRVFPLFIASFCVPGKGLIGTACIRLG